MVQIFSIPLIKIMTKKTAETQLHQQSEGKLTQHTEPQRQPIK